MSELHKDRETKDHTVPGEERLCRAHRQYSCPVCEELGEEGMLPVKDDE